MGGGGELKDYNNKEKERRMVAVMETNTPTLHNEKKVGSKKPFLPL